MGNVQDNYANFVDEGSKSWTVCFDSQDVLINFAKQILLCKAMFSKEAELCSCELGPGEGREVELGDSLEVQLTSWMVDHQSLSRMIETTRNKEKGLRFKLGGRNYFSGLEAAIVGMKKGGRKFIIAPSENGRTAFDVEITKVKAVDQERKVPIEVTATNNNNNNILERVAKVGQPVVSRSKETPSEMPELEEVSVPRSVSAFSTPKSSRRHSHQEERRTTPIPILRADSPASLRSGHSAASGGQQLPVRVAATQPQPQLGVSQGAEFTMLMSEARLQNTEMRMNIQRVSDKVDTLISKGNSGAGEDVTRKLDTILEQNREIKHLLETSRAAAGAGSSNEESMSEGHMLKQQKLRRLEETLQEKEQQLEQRQLLSEERVAELEQQLEEAQQLVARTQLAARTEVRKLLSSTAKLLLAQFPSSEEAEYSGARVRDTIGHTFHLIGDRLQEKYGSGSSVPVAAVAPVPAEVEEWDAESDAE